MKLNNIDLNKLAVFSQVMEAGNYQRASEILNVTPSALSQSITSLEAALEVPLFNRVGKRLIATPLAHQIHQEFRTHHTGLLRALHTLQDKAQVVSGVLRVGAYLEFAKSQLSSAIGRFLDQHPQAQIKMVFDTPTRLHDSLAQGQIDLCFSIFPSAERKRIHSRRIYQEELVLIAPRGRLEGTPSFDEVMRTPMIEYYFNHQPIRRWMGLHFQKRPKKIPVRAFGATAEMVLALVREGVGIGIVPLYLTDEALAQSQVHIVRPSARRLLDYIWLLERETTPRPPLIQAFCEGLDVGRSEPLFKQGFE